MLGVKILKNILNLGKTEPLRAFAAILRIWCNLLHSTDKSDVFFYNTKAIKSLKLVDSFSQTFNHLFKNIDSNLMILKNTQWPVFRYAEWCIKLPLKQWTHVTPILITHGTKTFKSLK